MTTQITPIPMHIEAAAKIIFGAMRFAQRDQTPEWEEGGNSLMQDEARRAAAQVLAPLAPIPVPEGDTFAALIEAFRDWLVPEESPFQPQLPSVPGNSYDMIMMTQRGQRQALRERLTEQARIARGKAVTPRVTQGAA